MNKRLLIYVLLFPLLELFTGEYVYSPGLWLVNLLLI